MLIVVSAGILGGHAAILAAVGLLLAAAFRLLPALNQVLATINSVQVNGPALNLVEDELKTFEKGAHVTAPQTDVGVPALRLQKALRLKGVNFRYPTRTEPALSGIDLAVEAGESVGIVGPTGSGKSTLLDIMLGFLPPESGSITVDGVAMEDCREGWQRSVGYVPQDVYLVDDSIRVNVALGWRGAEIDDEAVAAGVRLAQLEDFIRELPAGLETVVGEGGVRLSGGQRQRLGLARALYIRPSVLILDEATSNLDVATEQRIVETLAALSSGLTKIVVTHRIPTVRTCDRILYLENGVVRFEGPYDDLMSFMIASGNARWANTAGAETRGDPVG
jgi:ABC-type multidrug transport system fused ATPase/permease subunit